MYVQMCVCMHIVALARAFIGAIRYFHEKVLKFVEIR